MQALLASLFALLAFAAVIVTVGWLRSDPQLPRVMARRGIVAGNDPATVRKVERAARRCAACRHIVRCEHWLVTGSEPLDDFCPNARLLDELAAARKAGCIG